MNGPATYAHFRGGGKVIEYLCQNDDAMREPCCGHLGANGITCNIPDPKLCKWAAVFACMDGTGGRRFSRGR